MTHDNDEFDAAELQALLDRAKGLPRELPAAPEAWANIRDRIESARVRPLMPRSEVHPEQLLLEAAPSEVAPSITAGTTAAKRFTTHRSRMVFAAAATLFLAVTTFTVLRDRTADTPNSGAIASTETQPSNGSVATASPSLELVFAQYDEATSDLTRDLEGRRSRLQPDAVSVIDSCLTTIDRAIKESRSALSEEPDNATIAELLQLSYQQKIDLLRRATELPLGSL